MGWARKAGGLLLLASVLGGCGAAPGNGPVPAGMNGAAPRQAAPAEVRARLLAAMNAERRTRGLAPLAEDRRLTRAAQAHADDLARRGYFSHSSPEGATPLRRVTQAGYTGCLVAENLSYGWGSAERAVAEWMRSPGHRANLLNDGMREAGVGVGPNALFVAVFAAPCR
ncbi:CAP domain-containing protein [Celeribacter indicus]|uniref:SCP domain-containing protein n=1 Tax=Celeribacter indicus TaxID=1208324 RepID=A0A0B5E1B0_9RHOB|nr:CAP domain-containing protein [Celeribacter indicus]AJE46242.1 hypothetical protein P73_1527 [Celeribacter indicus]SDW50891.1 Cysteine-rich secretory protein family protein [Celeribacter indicus]